MRWAVLALCLVIPAAAIARNYQCDWYVNGIGGGAMSSTSYQVKATAGQTAAGGIESSNFLARIGYWQGEFSVGIQEERPGPGPGGLVMRLHSLAPNPVRTAASVWYSLASEGQVELVLCDLAGRVVRKLVNGRQRPGQYTVRWDGRDSQGRSLAPGVYFCRFRAGDCQTVAKLLMVR